MLKSDHLVVLCISHKYPPGIGGMEKQSYELINGMAKRIPVFKIVYSAEEPLWRFFLKLNTRICAMLKAHPEINLIHFNDGLLASFALFHQGYRHIQRVVTVHGLDVVFPWRFFQKNILPRFNRYDHIIAVSRATAKALVDRGVAAEKVSVVCNGIDQELSGKQLNNHTAQLFKKYHLARHKKYIILLGRPVLRKGFSWFMEKVLPLLDPSFHVLLIGPFHAQSTYFDRILPFIPHKIAHLLMLFVGYPSDRPNLQVFFKSNAMRSRVSHLGKLPAEDLYGLLNRHTIFAMPNIPVAGDMEGFGLVALEASICGALVFASDIEGIVDAVQDQKNGMLLTSNQPDVWARAINNTLVFPAYYEQIAAAAVSYTLETFSWDKMVSQYIALFKSLLDYGPKSAADSI